MNKLDTQSNIFSHFAFPVGLVLVMAGIHLFSILGLAGPYEAWGNQPRDIDGLTGIFTSHLRHASWGHWLANAIPLVMLAGMGSVLMPKATRIAWWIIPIGSGALLWLWGRDAIHIGASGLVYGWFFFLVGMALLQRSVGAIVGLIFALGLFGGLLWVFDSAPGVSWEGHVSGAMSGVGAAWVLRKRRKQEPLATQS